MQAQVQTIRLGQTTLLGLLWMKQNAQEKTCISFGRFLWEVCNIRQARHQRESRQSAGSMTGSHWKRYCELGNPQLQARHLNIVQTVHSLYSIRSTSKTAWLSCPLRYAIWTAECDSRTTHSILLRKSASFSFPDRRPLCCSTIRLRRRIRHHPRHSRSDNRNQRSTRERRTNDSDNSSADRRARSGQVSLLPYASSQP